MSFQSPDHETLKGAVNAGKMIFIALPRLYGLPRGLYLNEEGRRKSKKLVTEFETAKTLHTDQSSGQENYHVHVADTLSNLFDAFATIKAIGGKDYFSKINMTWHGWVEPYHRFYVSGVQKQADLHWMLHMKACMRDLSYTTDEPNIRNARIFPRLMRFNPDPATREHRKEGFISRPITIERQGFTNTPVNLTHRLYLQNISTRSAALLRSGCYILSTPFVLSTAASWERWKINHQLRRRMPFEMEIGWDINGDYQLHKPRKQSAFRLPRPEVKAQPLLI